MKQAATADGDRPVYSLRTSRTRMDRVAARAHNLGLPDRNAGIEAALEAWTDDADADAPVSLKDILDEVRALRKQVSQLTGTTAGGAGREPVRPAAHRSRGRWGPHPQVQVNGPGRCPGCHPVPGPGTRRPDRKRGRAKPGCGHHVPAGTRCKICQPAAK